MKRLLQIILISLVFSACKKDLAPQPDLEGTKWEFVGYMQRNKLTKITDSERVLLFFEADGKIIGRSMANSFNGKWEKTGNKLSIKIGIMTLVYEPQSGEEYLEKIEKTDSYRIEKSRLYLNYNEGKRSIVFKESEQKTIIL